MPIQKVRKTLTKHYVDNNGEIFWVGTSRMTPFVQRLEFADDDGLKRADYPVDYLVGLRDQIDPSNALAAAYAEIAYSAFFLGYASDLATGRVILSKIDRDHFQKPRKLDLLAMLEGVGSARNPSQYLGHGGTAERSLPGAQVAAARVSHHRRRRWLGNG